MIDVARVAGVSAQTVSRVLSGHPNVTERTREKVEAVVNELGYRKNNAARMLSSGRTHALGVVLLQTHFYSRTAITVGIEEAATAAGYTVSAATTSSLDAEEIEAALSRLADQRVEGVVLALPLLRTTRAIEEFAAATPTIAINGSRARKSEVVAIDQARIARLATEHLLELGHRTVWHVSGPMEWQDAASRSDGWRSTLNAAGITPPPILEGDWSPASGYRSGLILGRIDEVTAVFAASDEMAFGVIRALHELGKSVPGDVSVVGVDDIELAEYCSPSLTTVAQPFAMIGKHAVNHLLQAIESPAAEPECGDIRPSLMIRTSTSAPPR
ncbi:LacI family DNA-binding transcriptional regulator [Spelaeicoccus albus]|uniref:DNA-binding LacI/PurR family transcriptional regulator n=1 Tax=Spelaeicoccus albus TaxID=1280376 RepID=A0A7Z0ABN1_9MICO|nr:LacI family DNA-binding transcriptional regulator [Spelaeicoccus albus]NYI66688.1 DNA-binding LacI/PurR family transcriptional regulator [Spelaeicoccus albus]